MQKLAVPCANKEASQLFRIKGGLIKYSREKMEPSTQK